jgi:hypothetical protein
VPFLVPSTSPLYGRVGRRLPRLATNTYDSAIAKTRGNPQGNNPRKRPVSSRKQTVFGLVAEAGLKLARESTHHRILSPKTRSRNLRPHATLRSARMFAVPSVVPRWFLGANPLVLGAKTPLGSECETFATTSPTFAHGGF